MTHGPSRITTERRNEEKSMTDEIQQVPATSPNFQTDIARQLADLLPEIVADGKIDVAALQAVLGDDISTENERFGLFWPGKTKAIRAAQTPSTATLAPDHGNSVDWDNTQNVVIEGDNLEVLKVLQKHYYGKIKMIYIDPPYNTGEILCIRMTTRTQSAVTSTSPANVTAMVSCPPIPSQRGDFTLTGLI